MSRQSELAQLGRVFDNSALSNRNLIINGSFTVSQRGDYTTATAVSNNAYSVDRWKDWSSIAVTHQNASVTINGKTYKSLKVSATASSASAYIGARQFVEGINLISGETYTVHCYIRTNSPSARLRAYRLDGVAGLQTDPIPSDEEWHKVELTTTYSGSFNPEVGAIIYGNETVTSISAGDYVEFALVQLEVGDTATPFEHRSYGQELALCERYLQTLPVGGGAYTAIVGYDGSIAVINLRQTMRASPSLLPTGITGYGSGNTEYRVYLMSNAGGGFAGSPVAVNFFIDFSTPTKVRIVCSHASGWYNSAYEVSGSFIDVGAGCKILLEAEL